MVPDDAPLPPGWEMQLDESTGRYYFIDHNNKSTQWRHPITNKLYIPNKLNQSPQTVSSDQSEESTAVTDVVQKARLLQPEIDNFKGVAGDKEYRRLMETLDRLILSLDAVEIQGQQEIRTRRRAAIREIQQLIEMLEFRAQVSQQQNDSNNHSNTTN